MARLISRSINSFRRGRSEKGATYFKGNGTVEYAAAKVDLGVTQALKDLEARGFAGGRVDLVAHSYGGAAARWYLQTHSENSVAPADSLGWYHRFPTRSGPTLYTLSPQIPTLVAWSRANTPGHRVRKFITLASLWRGTPAANFVNELHADPLGRDSKLRQTRLRWGRLPLLKIKTVKKLSDGILAPLLSVRVPAMEVMGVESPWLRTLNAHPFQSDIAYEAIAGSDNAYIPSPLPGVLPWRHIDPFTTLTTLLPRDTLPVFGWERREKRRTNLTDGIVPIWSAVIEPRSRVFPVAHNAILWDDAAKTYLAQALCDRDLSGGDALRKQWRAGWAFRLALPAEAENPPDQVTWQFNPPTAPDAPQGAMAPLDRALAYELRGVARLAPGAIRALPPPLAPVTDWGETAGED